MGKEMVYSYIKEIAMRLKEPRKFGEASVMIGAGFSKNAKSKGMDNILPPNWNELAERMYCELYPKPEEVDGFILESWEKQRTIKTSGKNVTKLADEYIVNFDRTKLNRLIEDAIADDLFLPGELHKKLLRLSWGDVFTTNYDTLLERASTLVFREKNYKLVYSQNDLPGSIKPRIIKLHGSFPQVKPYIISDEDYRTYPVKYSAMVNTVQQAMLETRLCLIGFSGDDPNFQSWLGWLRDNMGENCPKIYLIGIYDDLSTSEKKLLENKQITVIDISVLVDQGKENKYYEAISNFLDLLKRFQEEEDIFERRPYPKTSLSWKPEKKEEYIKSIGKYSNEVKERIQPYVLIPEKIRTKYADYFMEHFSILLRNYKEQAAVVAIGNVVRILRKCLVILNDADAKCLEEICGQLQDISVLTNDALEALTEIDLYLLEMYRIDGKEVEYQKKEAELAAYENRVLKYKNEIIIEKIKKEIIDFKYGDAKNLIESIEESSLEYKIRKAGLYKQVSENAKAKDILEECSAEIAQMKLSDELYASYLGYLNLCYRSANWGWKIADEYSDMRCYENLYNTRHIIVKQREELSQEFFKNDCKEENNLPFNLNTVTSTHTLIGRDTLYEKCFSFIMAIDRLCLPLFSGQILLVPRVVEQIICSSTSAYWKIAFVAEANDDKIIEQVFTRKTLESIGRADVTKLFKALMSVANLYQLSDVYNVKKYFLSPRNMINVLSRLVVFLPDESIIEFLELISRLSYKDDIILTRDFYTIITRIATRFNGLIAEKMQEIIFSGFNEKYHIASYFGGIDFQIDENKAEEYYRRAISLAKEDNIEERDCGIAQLLLLWKNHKLEKYSGEVESAVWGRMEGSFPKSNLYYHFVWEELPHPGSVKFSELYYSYLLKDRYVTSVTDNGFLSNDSLDSVHNYLNFFYSTIKMCLRKCEKIIVDEKLCSFMLKTAFEFVEHEKKLLLEEFDIFGERDETKQKFAFIEELVAIVFINAIIEGFISTIRSQIVAIKNLLLENQISVETINMVEAIEVKQYERCMVIFENTILTKNKKEYSGVFIGMQCLLFYLECRGEKCKDVDEEFKNFMGAIKYLDIEYAKNIWCEIEPLIKRNFFLKPEAQKYIALSIHKCIDLYERPAEGGERFYLDGLYNCVRTLQRYYGKVIEESDQICSEELRECVDKAQNIDNYEIKNIWNR